MIEKEQIIFLHLRPPPLLRLGACFPIVRGAGGASAKEERGAVYRCLYGAFRNAFEVRATSR